VPTKAKSSSKAGAKPKAQDAAEPKAGEAKAGEVKAAPRVRETDLLRLATAGSVDDGKSTLIGRLLYDSKTLFEDQLAAVERVSKERGHDFTDLALLTDGLRAEREQGITIDVAYRSFVTATRRFQLADAPGHVP
jgi:sulfate adenylyltransferase subunit 1 (EFTu-like GTPase family)